MADPSPAGPETLPVLVGDRVTLRSGTAADVPLLHAILSEPSVVQWWGQPDNDDVIAAHLRGEDDTVLLVIETDRVIAGGIQYDEEEDEMYRHAGMTSSSPGATKGAASGPRR